MLEQDLLIIEEIEDMMDTLLGEIEPQALFFFIYLSGRLTFTLLRKPAAKSISSWLSHFGSPLFCAICTVQFP